jgi:very-short-patch-repair endonuclease
MRWVVRSDQAKYMRERQDQNLKKQVPAEIWAAEKLKATNRKWVRQAIWGCRLFDFWCHELGIAVEIDGLTHDKDYDRARDQYNYYRSGIVVLRVPNFDELAMQNALDMISQADSWAARKLQMRQEFGLKDDESFSQILKKVGLKKARGNWQVQK